MIKFQSFSAQDIQKLLDKSRKSEEEPLMELIMYTCYVKEQKIVCKPVHRLFKVSNKKNVIEVTGLKI
ncbi:hypothetical protein T552_02006 [Pneumocystis carinii B80]|uniref:Uncharacterized protein n=1 Tax=Pneumocystis carinii (strain B80) TaxID=1408658 RepID=A0A0W4ZIE5_PNEC8|nr:hypothetical protein T552_02006 [Pneumocystis carinii B80]KTW28147.1 hypothetical protein T552_02006 [Pneumocystis carinii B80]